MVAGQPLLTHNPPSTDGYKAHVCAEPDTGPITAVDLTAGNTADAEAAAGLLQDEPAGTVVLADSAYGTGALRAEAEDRDMEAVIKPPPLRTAVAGGYSIDDFDIDTEAATITCPPGSPSRSRPKGRPASVPAAGAARCGRAAPLPKPAAPSDCTPPAVLLDSAAGR